MSIHFADFLFYTRNGLIPALHRILSQGVETPFHRIFFHKGLKPLVPKSVMATPFVRCITSRVATTDINSLTFQRRADF